MAVDDDVLDDASRIEAEMRLPGILLEVGSYDWDPLIENDTIFASAYGGDAALAAPPHVARLLRARRHQCPFHRRGGSHPGSGGDAVQVPLVRGPVRFVRCRYEPDRFESLTGLGREWTADVLKACLDIRDARLHEAMMRLGHEALAPGFGAESLAEGLAMAVAVDIARHIRSLEPEPEMYAGGLAPWQLRRITAYVASHPGVKADMVELAALCGISGRHLRRLFKQTTRQTLQD